MAHGGHSDGRLDGQHLRTLLQALDSCGHDPMDFLDGAPGRMKELAHPRTEVTLDELVSVVERLAEAGGEDSLARVAKAYASLHPVPRLLSGYLLPPRHFFQALGAALEASTAWPVDWREDDGGFDISVTLRARPSRPFLTAVGLVLAALPDVLGVDATVDVMDLTAASARFRVTPGKPRGLALRVSDSQLTAIVGTVLSAGRQHKRSSPRAAVPSVAVLEERFALTRAEARVARRLAMGRSLKHIAKELDISPETARTHAKRAMQKTQTHRQAELVSVVLGLERD
ncbi:MAG: helix-turn-helix transcriptional regulator [Myxococcota bacterium]